METKKVALLVTAQFRTRVIVEVPQDFDSETTEDVQVGLEGQALRDLVFLAESNICQAMGNDELGENIVEVVNDLECPFDPVHDTWEVDID